MPKAKRAEASEVMADSTLTDELAADVEASAEAELSEAPVAKKQKKGKATGAVKRTGTPQPYENGVLRALVLENFMNHKHFKIEFDPHVNFIVGKNGSGKSAIVNALIAGFGHRASSTGRNTNTSKSLIMHGKSHALIQVHIANGGEDAFKPNEFGDTIVAEHRLDRNGAGTYKLRNGPDGPARSSSKKEFTEMCSHFNIQANNPCALLTQEHAKKFLHHGDEEARYKFFLQAANLESRKHDLNMTLQNVELLKARLSRAEEGMAEKMEYAKACQAAYDNAVKLKQLAKKEESFEALLGWAHVGDKERELEEEVKKEEAARREEDEAKADADAAHGKQTALEDALQAKEKEHSKAHAEITKLGSEGEKTRQRFSEIGKEVKKAKKAVVQLEADLESEEQVAATLEEQYTSDLAALEDTQSAAQAAQMRRRHDLNEEIRVGENAQEMLLSDVEATKAKYQNAIDAKRIAGERMDAAQQAYHEKNEELKVAKKAGFDRARTLHPDLPAFLDLLKKNAKAFQRPPLGPFGLNVQIKPEHEKLGPAAELAIGLPQLLGFIVSCKEDEDLLRKCCTQFSSTAKSLGNLARIAIRDMDQTRHALNRGTSSGSGGRTPRSSAADGIVRLFDVVDITAKNGAEDAWHNYFLDNCQPEEKLVFATLEEAERAIWESAEARVTGIVGFDYGKPGRRLFKRNRTTGNEAVAPLRRILATDKKSAVAALEKETAAVSELYTAAADEHKSADLERKEMEQAEKKKRKELKEAEVHLDRLRTEFDRLSGESASDHVTAELQETQGKYDEAKRNLVLLEAQLRAARERHAEEKERFEPVKEKMENMKAKYEAMMEHADTLKQEVAAARQPLQKSRTTQSSVQKRLRAAQDAQEKASESVRSCREWIERMTPGVEDAYGPRVHDPQNRSLEQLKKEHVRLQAQIKDAEKKNGGKSIMQLATEAEEAKKTADKNTEEIATVRAMGEKEEEAFIERSQFFKREAKNKGRQAHMDFNTRLSRKGHAGKLAFNHDAETLSLSVTRNNQDENSGGTSDARNLSGGERSFTTLSFELAMWEFCETPFRVLDEFDVYMDDTYRRQAVDVLMELCDQQKQRQFLFVTPQDMHPYLQDRAADMPRVIKMKDVR